MPSITSCEANGATLRTVGNLIGALIGGKNCNFVESSSEMRTVLFESALCKREGDKVGRGRRLLGFRLITSGEIRLALEPESISPCAWT